MNSVMSRRRNLSNRIPAAPADAKWSDDTRRALEVLIDAWIKARDERLISKSAAVACQDAGADDQVMDRMYAAFGDADSRFIQVEHDLQELVEATVGHGSLRVGDYLLAIATWAGNADEARLAVVDLRSTPVLA